MCICKRLDRTRDGELLPDHAHATEQQQAMMLVAKAHRLTTEGKIQLIMRPGARVRICKRLLKLSQKIATEERDKIQFPIAGIHHAQSISDCKMHSEVTEGVSRQSCSKLNSLSCYAHPL